MSQLYHFFVADENEAQQICDVPLDWPNYISLPAFDEAKQLSLLSLFRDMPKVELPEFPSVELLTIYHKYFTLLYPSELGDETYVAKFPDDFVQELATLEDDAIPELVSKWCAIEPSFAKYQWTEPDIDGLVHKLRSVCQNAIRDRKHVLYRFSL
jgi:hypothetical protein